MKNSANVRRVGGFFASSLLLALGVAASGCAAGGGDESALSQERKVTPPEEQNPPCRLTGGGRILAFESPDTFGGNAQPFRRGAGGEWEHQTHDGTQFHGDPDIINCWVVEDPEAAPPVSPANAILFSGVGTYDGEDGCSFRVYIEDHGEPELDYYMIEISCQSGASYSIEGDVYDGNLQIHAVPPGFQP